MNNLDNIIKERNFKNIYLIFGEEYYLKNIYEKKIIDSIVPKSVKMMNFDILEGKTVEVSRIKEICDTLPFMNEHRAVLIRNSQLFVEGRKAETEKITEYIKEIPKTTILLFFEEKVDKRLKLFKEVKKFGDIFEFNNLNEKELCQWILKKFYENNKKISDATAIYLIRNIGDSMELLSNEINKLISYKEFEEITKQDIDEICTKSIESKIFDLVGAIGNKNIEKAMNVYKGLIFNKVSPFMILSMIARQFRIILQVKYLNKQGKSINNIAKELGLRDFVVKEALLQSNNFTNKVLLEAINECLEIDNKSKTGFIQDELGVEMLIVKYSSLVQ